jgi:epoxyqueuosine reductase
MGITEQIKQKGLELGFDLVGVSDAGPLDFEEIEYFNSWLGNGWAGQMGYMHRNFDKRTNPGRLLEGAKSVVCVGICYKPDLPEGRKQVTGDSPIGRIANYALYEDYHSFIKGLLRKLVEFMKKCSGREDLKSKVCVDSVPLAERSVARRAGLGFIGRNHMLINPDFGLQIFLGEIVTDLELRPDRPLKARCRSCDKCIKSCPTGAIGFDGSFDATKCISYLTTEYEGIIPESLSGKIGCRLFGCDECVLVCPYEERSRGRSNRRFKFFSDRQYMDLSVIKRWDRAGFEHYFADTVIERLGFERLKRNTKVCLENISGG